MQLPFNTRAQVSVARGRLALQEKKNKNKNRGCLPVLFFPKVHKSLFSAFERNVFHNSQTVTEPFLRRSGGGLKWNRNTPSYDVTFRLWHHGGEIEFIGKEIVPPISNYSTDLHVCTMSWRRDRLRRKKEKKTTLFDSDASSLCALNKSPTLRLLSVLDSNGGWMAYYRVIAVKHSPTLRRLVLRAAVAAQTNGPISNQEEHIHRLIPLAEKHLLMAL